MGVPPTNGSSASRAVRTDTNSESWCTTGCDRRSPNEAWTRDGKAASGWVAVGVPAPTWSQSTTPR
eukprot:10191367-Alexandrium_andersonii.AAC.1